MKAKSAKVRLSVVLAMLAVAITSVLAGIAVGKVQPRVSNEEVLESACRKHGYAHNVLFVFRDVKAGDVLTKGDLAMRDYITDGVRDRLLHFEDLSNVLGRKMRVDLKRMSVLLKTDIEQ